MAGDFLFEEEKVGESEIDGAHEKFLDIASHALQHGRPCGLVGVSLPLETFFEELQTAASEVLRNLVDADAKRQAQEHAIKYAPVVSRFRHRFSVDGRYGGRSVSAGSSVAKHRGRHVKEEVKERVRRMSVSVDGDGGAPERDSAENERLQREYECRCGCALVDRFRGTDDQAANGAAAEFERQD
eukprot:TRINITY_DN7758_c0_g1_i2.p2 TRINITY_DN7758_c0_g1~~TRINITY_DN7758_c0_g1_i2.p2  ORF type:complete len:185 (-),score=13.23 TRINITY_DN7758_c0_g1_i2:131-685(-)